jgi:hypothetical protein
MDRAGRAPGCALVGPLGPYCLGTLAAIWLAMATAVGSVWL